MMKPGRAVHPTNAVGTASDGATTLGGDLISFDPGTNKAGRGVIQVIITNAEAAGANLLEVSFDGGVGWFSIATASTLAFDILCSNCRLRGNGGTAAYSIMGIIA